MKVSFTSYNLNTELLSENRSSKFLFFLHGFTGSLKDWKDITQDISKDFNVIGIDLIGHGSSDSPNDPSLYSSAAISSQLHKIISLYTTEKIWLSGYSMGGRAAISFAFNFPWLIEGLILESSSPGLKSNEEKSFRVNKDAQLINYISEHTIEQFTSYWMNLDIFSTQRRFSEEKRALIYESKLFNNKIGLINSLKGFGTGVMPSYWSSLSELNIKTLLITGSLDTKYSEINSEMSKLIPLAEHKIIQSAGHNTHLEEPKQYINILNEFLSSF